MTIDIDDLRVEVESIAEGVEKIRCSGITDDALIMLIQRAAPSITTGRYNRTTKPSKKMIEAVLEGIEGLEEYVFGSEEDGDGQQS